VRPPDGEAHDVTFAYTGARLISRTTKIATSRTSGGDILESPSTTSEEYDLHGRLYKVTEPSGEANADVTTTYAYDVGDRLATAVTSTGASGQGRAFFYDNRGFLRFEDLPEKVPPAGGRSGDCATHDVCYSDYDARGHVGRIHDGDHVLRHEYDRAERLLTVKALLGTPQVEYPIKEFTYGAAVGDSLGKLVQAIQHNRHDPANPNTDFPVTENYTYAGLGGRVSSRATQVSSLGSCSQTFTWTALGEQQSIGYPKCDLLGTGRTITYEYASGFLTGVKQGADTIAEVSYHGNTMINAIAHGNGVTVTHGPDPNAMRRPALIATSGVTGTPGNWDTGAYTYDGAGNVKTIGPWYHLYDLVSRVKRRHWPSDYQCQPGDICINAGFASDYNFDPFGNMLGWTAVSFDIVDGASLPTDQQTNRLTQAQYDAAGNVTSWFDTTFGWYPGNQMRSMGEVLGINQLYAYTADGERIATYDAPTETYHVTVRDLGGKVLRLFEVSGGEPHVWTEKQDWVYRGGALLATFEGGVERYYHLDHLGTPRLVTSDAGAWIRSDDPEPFGADPWWKLPQDTSRMQLTGHERDAHDPTRSWDDVYYLHARYYNPNVARFLSTDPVRGDSKRPQSFNLYSYVGNNPINRVDPDGRNWFNIGGSWQYHEGAEWKDKDGNIHKSKFTHLLVVTSTGQTNKSGATLFNVTLYNQNKVAMTGTAWSGSAQSLRIPAHNYLIQGGRQVPSPTTVNPNSSVWPGNPPPMWGIQKMPAFIGPWPEQASYGPIRARLNPTPFAPGAYDGNYYHGQDADMDVGATHGCLCYGKDPSIIQYVWDTALQLPVALDTPVGQP
ncbi:MAG: RHS repeat-associated core domain-containing protein, partial [Acidobacteriota bacterium]